MTIIEGICRLSIQESHGLLADSKQEVSEVLHVMCCIKYADNTLVFAHQECKDALNVNGHYSTRRKFVQLWTSATGEKT